MTEHDKLFLETLTKLQQHNRENDTDKKILLTSKAVLSEELLQIYGLKGNGGWAGNVYVEFEPLFKTKEALDWQK